MENNFFKVLKEALGGRVPKNTTKPMPFKPMEANRSSPPLARRSSQARRSSPETNNLLKGKNVPNMEQQPQQQSAFPKSDGLLKSGGINFSLIQEQPNIVGTSSRGRNTHKKQVQPNVVGTSSRAKNTNKEQVRKPGRRTQTKFSAPSSQSIEDTSPHQLGIQHDQLPSQPPHNLNSSSFFNQRSKSILSQVTFQNIQAAPNKIVTQTKPPWKI